MNIDCLTFEPKELDIPRLRELPAAELAKATAIPATVLGLGLLSSREEMTYTIAYQTDEGIQAVIVDNVESVSAALEQFRTERGDELAEQVVSIHVAVL